MKVDILDIDRLIEVNKLSEVKSPKLFSNKMIFDPEGILSNEIFGISKGDRRSTFAYIDLKRPFIHPHIYAKVLKPMFRGSIYIVSGQRKYVIKNGMPVEDEHGWTGIENLYKHWDEIDWDKSKSVNKTNKDLLKKLTKKDVFITKMLVCPPAYRDVMLSGTKDTSDHVSELNDLYTRLIRSVGTLSEGGIFARTQYATQARIEDTLVEIMNYFKELISRKQGLIRKFLIGKSVDYGVRSVISAVQYNNETIQDNMVDLEHSAVPIAQCCSAFYPFIEAWVKNFLTREVINDPNNITYRDTLTGQELTATMKDANIQFSDKNIRKMINDFCLNPDNRFKIITVDVIVPTSNGDEIRKASLMLKGKIITDNNISTVLSRPMTITDLLYLACVDVCENSKRHVMVSRYPVGTDKGIFFSNIRVQSTSKHIKVIFNGREYPYYPNINFEIPHNRVGVQFIDSLVYSNSHLDGMGADYDGDTVSLRGIWSDEANLEAEEIMNNKMTALNITGGNSKVVAKEVFNSMYELTKDGPSPKHISVSDQNQYLGMKPDEFTRSELADMFADMVQNSDNTKSVGKHKARYNTWDVISIPEDYFYKGQVAMDMNIGRFVFNKYILEGAGVIVNTKIYNMVVNKSSLGDLDDLIGEFYMEDVINRQQFNRYTDRRDNLGYWLNGMLAHTISERMLKPLKEVEKKKAELCKKYEKELSSGNIDVMTNISNELVAYAKELLKGDPGMDLYDSGDLDFGNNYKNNSIIKGAVMNKITNEYDFIASSFMDGIEIKDLPAHANSILASQFPASIATADAGYLGKKILALLQMMEVDFECEDCGTKKLIPITITKYNKKNMLYTYIDQGGQLEMLTRDNISSYIGKEVRMRSPMTCKNDKICLKCAGMLFKYLGVKHAGLFGVQISHADLNLALKAKHNSLVNLYTFNPDNIIEDID